MSRVKRTQWNEVKQDARRYKWGFVWVVGCFAILLLLNSHGVFQCPDHDGDGHAARFCRGSDCDDTNPAVYPGADEECGIDNNCDGKIRRCSVCLWCPDFPSMHR